VLFLATSCLQARPLDEAIEALCPLADGVQLAPGNLPSARARELVDSLGAARTRHHHTFDSHAPKRAIYARDGSMLRTHERWSVHPPLPREEIDHELWFALACAAPWATEVMYPGERLGTGAEILRAMRARMPLAVDISHLYIQRCAGAIDEQTLRALFDYDNIVEVHVSANNGSHDSHQPLTERTFGLPWARERLTSGTPTVLECYMHRLSLDDRRRQIDLVRTDKTKPR